MTPQNSEQDNLYVKALLACGAEVEIRQREKGMVIELSITPRTGRIEHTAYLSAQDNCLHVMMTKQSFIGVYQLLDMITNPPKRKNFLDKFVGIFR